MAERNRIVYLHAGVPTRYFRCSKVPSGFAGGFLWEKSE